MSITFKLARPAACRARRPRTRWTRREHHGAEL